MYKINYSKKDSNNTKFYIHNLNQDGGNLSVTAVNNGVEPGKSNLEQAGTGVQQR